MKRLLVSCIAVAVAVAVLLLRVDLSPRGGWRVPAPTVRPYFLHVGISLLAVPAFVQSVQCNTGGFSCTTGAITVTAGNALFISNGFGRTSPTLSVSDSQSDVFNVVNALHHFSPSVGNAFSAESWLASSAIGGSTTFTCTSTDNTDNGTCEVAELSGVSVTDQVNAGDTQGTAATGNATTGTTGSTTAAAEIVIASYHATLDCGTPWVKTTGFDAIGSSQNAAGVCSAVEYRVVSSAGTFTGTAQENVLRNTIGFIATFKAAGGATRCGGIGLVGIGCH